MSIPPEIQRIIEQINRNLNEIERDANQGIEIVNRLLSRFPNNRTFIEYLAQLGNYSFFVEITRRQIETVRSELVEEQVFPDIIQENGEFLSEIQGRVFDAKTTINQLVTRLENLQ